MSDVALPPLTPEQRAAALEKAAVARKQRAEVKERLKHSGATLESVLADADDGEVIGKMKVSAVLESLPGVGKVRANKIMERLEISPDPSRPWPGCEAARRTGRRVQRQQQRLSPLADRQSDFREPVASRLTVLSGPSGVGKGSVVRRFAAGIRTSGCRSAPRPGRPVRGSSTGSSTSSSTAHEFARMRDADELLGVGELRRQLLRHSRAPRSNSASPTGSPGSARDRVCRARARSGSPCRRRVWCSWLRPPGVSWSAASRLAPPSRPTSSDDGWRWPGAELAAEGEFDAVVVNDEIEAAADRLVDLMLD